MRELDVDVDMGDDFKGMDIPSFKEFCRDPEKFLGRPDDVLSQVDKGGRGINAVTQRHVYEIEGYKCNTLEEVERVAKSQGIPVQSLDYQPQVMPNLGHKCDLKIVFIPKWRRERRAQW